MKLSYEGKYIFLRRLKLADADDIYKNIRTRQISYYTYIPYPYKTTDAPIFIRKSFRDWRKQTGYHMAVCSKETRKLIGVVGYQNILWRERRAEIGYWISKKYWGKGYMSEAVNLMLHFGFEELNFHKVFAYTLDENIGSQKVLLKNGFIKEGHLHRHFYRRRQWHDGHYYAIIHDVWKNKKDI